MAKKHKTQRASESLSRADKEKLFPKAKKTRTRAEWQDLAQNAAKYGYDVNPTGRQTRTWKNQVTKARRLLSLYSEKNRFVFRKQTPQQLQKLSKHLSARQLTPNGVFIQKPKGIPSSKVSVKADKKGVLTVRYGKRVERIVKIDAKDLILNPASVSKKAIKAGSVKGKRIRSVHIMVNGFQGKNTIRLDQFHYYMANNLLPELLSPKRRKGKLSAEDISDTFQVKIVYQNKR